MGSAATAIGALADPIRRRLYRYVSERREAVSREETAAALGIPLAQARFHLDRLADEGLLDTEYRRLTGRQGPGAGRPAKLYRRSSAEFRVSLPERRYDVMGGILATAVERAQHGEDLGTAIAAAAHEAGVAAAEGAVGGASSDFADTDPDLRTVEVVGADGETLRTAASALTGLGYEAECDEGAIRLRNCPFDALAQDHLALVCTTNERFVQGVLDGSGCDRLRAELEPCPGYCCVVAREVRDR